MDELEVMELVEVRLVVVEEVPRPALELAKPFLV
jgi:hypothetical protein